MSFFNKKMAREVPATVPNDGEKPLPLPRPGTSGTENILVTQTRVASQNYQKAHRAETAYRAKKRAGAARRDFGEARVHFKEARKHFRQTMTLTFSAIKAVPYIYGERRELARQKEDERKRQRAIEQKKKLEEKLAREIADGESINGKEPASSS